MNIRISDLKKIARKVKKIKCAEHKKTATVMIKNNGIELSDFCCDNFDEKLHETTKNMVIEQVKEYEIEKAQKNAWRKF